MLMRAAENGALFLVADGIGGRKYGQIVSGMLRDGYDRWWEERFLPAGREMSFQTAMEEIKSTLFRLNREIIDRFGPSTAGSTLALLFLFRGNCLTISAGDSRIYRARKWSVRQITIDDVAGGENAPPGSAGKLLGALGISTVPDFYLWTDTLRGRDRFFLCSDGVYRFLPPQYLVRRISSGRPAPEELVAEFSREVERNGARDNYTMIYVRVKGE